MGGDLLFDLVGGARIELVECLRADRALFDAYACLPGMFGQGRPESGRPLATVLSHYRELFPTRGMTPHNLCISHEARIKLNKQHNQFLAPNDARMICVKGAQIHRCAAQSMLIWPGIKLLGCVGRVKKGVRNGCLYTIKWCGGNCPENPIYFEGLQYPFTDEEVKTMFRLSHAQTYSSCQGTEFSEACTLHELGHPRFTWRHLFVGISRCRAAELVSCA